MAAKLQQARGKEAGKALGLILPVNPSKMQGQPLRPPESLRSWFATARQELAGEPGRRPNQGDILAQQFCPPSKLYFGIVPAEFLLNDV